MTVYLKQPSGSVKDDQIEIVTTDGTSLFRSGTKMSDVGGGSVEGTAVLSTGETGGSKFLREDGDGTSSWQALAGGGDMVAANNLSDLTNAATARTNLGVDAAGTDNSDNNAVNTLYSGLVSNATHTGDVTGDTTLTIAAGAVDIAMMSATGTADSTTFLRGDNTWDVPAAAAEVDLTVAPADASMFIILSQQPTGNEDLHTDTGIVYDSTQEKLSLSGILEIDDIRENTSTAGVTIDGLLIKDSGIPEAAVTAHEAALSVTKSQISDFTEADYATGAEGDLAATALQDKADVEAVLTGEISSHTHAGGGGAPTENIILTATKTSGQNINGTEGTETDLTWDVVSQDTGELTSFTTGDSDVVFTNAGWVNIHASAYIANSLMNNRFMMSLSIYHYDSGDSLKYSYHGDMQYNRDDNAAYDASGGSVSQNMMYVAASDYIIIRTRVFDDGTAATSQTLDGTYSKLRIAQIAF